MQHIFVSVFRELRNKRYSSDLLRSLKAERPVNINYKWRGQKMTLRRGGHLWLMINFARLTIV